MGAKHDCASNGEAYLDEVGALVLRDAPEETR
jgi:hypothetical protein